MRLAIVVSFLNEEATLAVLLDSVAAQTRPPDQLVLVDDGSTDGSSSVATQFAREHPYAAVIRRPPRDVGADRLAMGSAVRAFEAGAGRLEEPWDIIAKLDADLRLNPRLFERLEDAFEGDPTLGMAGPYLGVANNGRLVRQRSPAVNVEGPAKFYRRECYEQITPLPAILGWDTVDQVRARMRGWRTASLDVPGGDCEHLRPMGSHDGSLRAFRRWGVCAYGYGEHPLHVVLVGVQKFRDRPRVIGGLSYVLGWALAALRRMPRAEPELRDFVRRDQLRRIRARIRRLGRPRAPE